MHCLGTRVRSWDRGLEAHNTLTNAERITTHLILLTALRHVRLCQDPGRQGRLGGLEAPLRRRGAHLRRTVCLLFLYYILCWLNCLFFREDQDAAFVIGLSGGSLPKFFAMGAAAMKVSSKWQIEVGNRFVINIFPGMFICRFCTLFHNKFGEHVTQNLYYRSSCHFVRVYHCKISTPTQQNWKYDSAPSKIELVTYLSNKKIPEIPSEVSTTPIAFMVIHTEFLPY